jgi:hypothetical protein
MAIVRVKLEFFELSVYGTTLVSIWNIIRGLAGDVRM